MLFALKSVQDDFFILARPESLLLGVLDGHGPDVPCYCASLLADKDLGREVMGQDCGKPPKRVGKK